MTLVDDTCDNCGGRFDPMGDPLLTKHPEIGPWAVFCATCETSVPPNQPPAAPETDVRLTEDEREALVDVVWPSNYLDPDLDAVVEAVEHIVAERVRVVEGERDAAEERLRGAYSIGAWADLTAERDREFRRAESAEAALAVTEQRLVDVCRDLGTLRAAVEALADSLGEAADELRALLGGAS